MNKYIYIVCEDQDGPGPGNFVEVEDDEGRSISIGTWVKREEGYLALRIPDPRPEDQR